MKNDDPFAKLIKEAETTPEARKISPERVNSIQKQIKKKQSQSDLLEFGFVKLWTIILEFFAKVHTSTHSNVEFDKLKNESRRKK